MASLLRAIGIYGWDGVEDVVLASLVNQSNLMMLGQRGTAKTYAAQKISQAFEVGSDGPYEFVKLDGYASTEEDFIGYPMPPGPAAIEAARTKNERLTMSFVYSPNTIAFAKMIVIDEATRIQPDMQNRYLGILDYRIVEGVKLPVEHVWGAANPLEYEATVPMDQALADRWHLMIEPPSLHQMPSESDRKAVLESVAVRLVNRAVDPNAAAQLVTFVARARAPRAAIVASRRDPFLRYVDAVVRQINSGLIDRNGKPIVGKAGMAPAPIDSRRAAIIVNNIIGLYSVSVAKGDRGNIKDDALKAFQHSIIDRLSSESGGIEDSVIESAHKVHSAILEDAQDPVVTQIERESDPAKRVALAFTLGAIREDLSQYTSAALKEIRTSKGDESAAAFAYALLSRLQTSLPSESSRLNRYVFDDLYPLVFQTMREASERTFKVDKVLVKDSSFESLFAFLGDIAKYRQTEAGRVALMITGLPYEAEANQPASASMTAEAIRKRTFASLTSRVAYAHSAVLEYVQILAPIGQTAVEVSTDDPFASPA